MFVKRRVLRNAAMATAQSVIVGLALFILFRFLLERIGIEKVGIWSLVLAATNVTRISELFRSTKYASGRALVTSSSSIRLREKA